MEVILYWLPWTNLNRWLHKRIHRSRQHRSH